MEHLGISIDGKKNASAGSGITEIQKDGAPVKILVVRTDEEGEIARQTVQTIENAGGRRNLSEER